MSTTYSDSQKYAAYKLTLKVQIDNTIAMGALSGCQGHKKSLIQLYTAPTTTTRPKIHKSVKATVTVSLEKVSDSLIGPELNLLMGSDM